MSRDCNNHRRQTRVHTALPQWPHRSAILVLSPNQALITERRYKATCPVDVFHLRADLKTKKGAYLSHWPLCSETRARGKGVAGLNGWVIYAIDWLGRRAGGHASLTVPSRTNTGVIRPAERRRYSIREQISASPCAHRNNNYTRDQCSSPTLITPAKCQVGRTSQFI